MASIPLPALDVRQPQQPDTLGDVSKLMALRSMMGQQQVQQQQIQAGQLENQQRQLALQDQQTLRESQKGVDWTQPDAFEKWIGNAQQKGVSPQTLSQLSLQRAQYQEQLSKTDTATLAAEKERNSQLQGHIDAVKGITDPVKRAQAAQLQGQQILQSGLAKTPQTQQLAQALAQGKYVPTDDELTLFENGLTDHNTQVTQAETIAKTRESNANAAMKEIETAGLKGLTPQLASQQVDNVFAPNDPQTAGQNRLLKNRVLGLLNQGDLAGAKNALREGFQSQLGVGKDILEATNPKIRQAKIDLAAATEKARVDAEAGDPSAMGEMMAKGMVAPSEIISKFKPEITQRMLTAANDASIRLTGQPFNAEKAEAQYNYARNPATQNTLNMIHAMTDPGGSIEIAEKAAKKLPQLDQATANKVFNAVGSEFGSAEATNFHTAMLGLADEYSKVMGGGVSSDTGRQQAMDLLKASYSTGQLSGAVATMKQDLAARKKALVRDNPTLNALYPETENKTSASGSPAGATHTGVGSVDKKTHWLDAQGKDLGVKTD